MIDCTTFWKPGNHIIEIAIVWSPCQEDEMKINSTWSIDIRLIYFHFVLIIFIRLKYYRTEMYVHCNYKNWMHLFCSFISIDWRHMFCMKRFFIQTVLGSTLSHANEASDRCIQFLKAFTGKTVFAVLVSKILKWLSMFMYICKFNMCLP